MPATETTRLNRPWLVKMVIFFAVLVFFGFYGLYDATIAYPERGMRFARYCEYQYLEAAKAAGQLTPRAVSVENPAQELQRLRSLTPAQASALDSLRRDWLEALNVVGALDPAHTAIDRPDDRYDTLRSEWVTSQGARARPKPLAFYDIPVQWLFVVIGLGGGLWMLILFISVARQRYGWDPATQTLYLPGGHTLTPADVEDFDKRKWDKFLIFLKIRPDHPTLGGREIKLDLYRYASLESWVLEMERTAFPERGEEPPPGAPEAEPAAPTGEQPA